jgi:hypothetical protein
MIITVLLHAAGGEVLPVADDDLVRYAVQQRGTTFSFGAA